MSNDKTPSEALAERVVDRLVKSKLIRSAKRDALIAKIASGAMRGEDWKLEIDLATSKASKK